MSTAVLTDGVILKSVNKIAKKNPEWGDAKVCAEVKKLHQITASGAALRVWRLTKARGAPAAAANDENSTPNTAPAATAVAKKSGGGGGSGTAKSGGGYTRADVESADSPVSSKNILKARLRPRPAAASKPAAALADDEHDVESDDDDEAFAPGDGLDDDDNDDGLDDDDTDDDDDDTDDDDAEEAETDSSLAVAFKFEPAAAAAPAEPAVEEAEVAEEHAPGAFDDLSVVGSKVALAPPPPPQALTSDDLMNVDEAFDLGLIDEPLGDDACSAAAASTAASAAAALTEGEHNDIVALMERADGDRAAAVAAAVAGARPLAELRLPSQLEQLPPGCVEANGTHVDGLRHHDDGCATTTCFSACSVM